MRIGLVVPPLDRVSLEAVATAAEDFGVEYALFRGGGGGWVDPVIAAEAFATLKHNPADARGVPRRGPPAAAGQSLASMDAASRGRLEPVAMIATDDRLHRYGLEPFDARERYREALTVIRSAWTCRPFRHTGRHWTIPARLAPNGTDLPDHVQMTTRPSQMDLPVWESSDEQVSTHLRHRTVGSRPLCASVLEIDVRSRAGRDRLKTLHTKEVDLALCSFAGESLVESMFQFMRLIGPRVRSTPVPSVILHQLDSGLDQLGREQTM